MSPRETMTRTEMMDRLDALSRIREELMGRRRFVVVSHVRPDGDSIGSQAALALALTALGKHVQIVNHDAAPAPLLGFPGMPEIMIAERVDGHFDAAVVLECGDLARTGLTGLESRFLINIDHHPGNAMFGAINWFDPSAAACGEIVFDVIAGLGVQLSVEMATHIYLAILTDTGSFHHSSISARTFDVCRATVEAGVDPVAVARRAFDTNTVERLRLFGAVLGSMEVLEGGRLATLHFDQETARRVGATYDDTDGLINVPLTVAEIQAVVFFKEWEAGQYRVSLRSKGDIDVGGVAKRFGGGGHKNAAGCTLEGSLSHVRALVLPLVGDAIARPAAEAGEPMKRTGDRAD
jgi:bifunctional oligoribonuclease and PAP phosphatase NrnA